MIIVTVNALYSEENTSTLNFVYTSTVVKVFVVT